MSGDNNLYLHTHA